MPLTLAEHMDMAAIIIRIKWNGHKDKRLQKCQLSHYTMLFPPAKINIFLKTAKPAPGIA